MKAIGIILAGGSNERLEALTEKRASSAMPMASCYRALDFPLSNMANSGIAKVAVITQFNSRSLHDHLSSAKWWDLGRKQGGLFIFSPYLSNDNSLWFKGTADSLYQNLTYLKRSNEPYVVIVSGNGIYKMDYNELLAAHVRHNADVTIAYTALREGDNARLYGVLEVAPDERILNFEEKPLEPQSGLISMGIYVMGRTDLINLLEAMHSEDRYDLVEDGFVRYRKRLRIYGCRFNGYWRALNSVKTYYDCNMDFLRREVRALFARQFPYIETKPKDEPPAKYNMGASVTDCLVGSGAILDGHAYRSVMFRRVTTGEHSSVSNAIIMEGCHIGSHCVVENAILDKEVILSDGKRITGESPQRPMIITKGTVL